MSRIVYVLNGPNLNLLGKRRLTSTVTKLLPMSRLIAAESPQTTDLNFAFTNQTVNTRSSTGSTRQERLRAAS